MSNANLAPTVLFESKNFSIVAPPDPHVDREDGGHLMVVPHVRVSDRTALTPALAVELARLTMLAGEGLTRALEERGIQIGRVNYQDNGNWSVDAPDGPHLHVHIYGRARGARLQPFGEALHFPKPHTGAYEKVRVFRDEELRSIREALLRLSSSPKYAPPWLESV